MNEMYSNIETNQFQVTQLSLGLVPKRKPGSEAKQWAVLQQAASLKFISNFQVHAPANYSVVPWGGAASMQCSFLDRSC